MSYTTNGRLIVVVGPSGAGKDSILKGAEEYFNDQTRVEFVRRTITRECDPKSELHDSLPIDQFIARQKRGEFSVWWQANGLYYGIPVNVFAKIDQGKLLIANGSRAAIADIRSKFKQLTVVHISVPDNVLASRLTSRRRETADQIEQRLRRNKTINAIQGDDVVTIDNSAARETAIDEFIALVESMLSETAK